MIKKLTCIVCPVGCTLTAELNNGKVEKITGNTCPKGKEYAENECISPMRNVQSTMRCKNGKILSVKTETPVPKEKIYEVMEIINKTHPETPVRIGDVLIENVCRSRVVATKNIN